MNFTPVSRTSSNRLTNRLNRGVGGEEGEVMTYDLQERIDSRMKELAKKACNAIGCSGIDPYLCQNHPQDCGIIRKFMGCKVATDSIEKGVIGG